MRSEPEVRALVMQIRRYAMQNPSTIRGLQNTIIAMTILSWVLGEATMGEVAYIVSDRELGAISGGGEACNPDDDEEVAG